MKTTQEKYYSKLKKLFEKAEEHNIKVALDLDSRCLSLYDLDVWKEAAFNDTAPGEPLEEISI